MISRPTIVYLHRYPLEYESVNCPVLFARLPQKFSVLYAGMRTMLPVDEKLRRQLKVIEIPFCINPHSGMDKLLKTILFYLYLPFLCSRIKRLHPDLIISQEPLPFVPILVGRMGLPTLIGGVSDFWWRIFLGGTQLGRWIANGMERFEIRQWSRLKLTVITNTKAEADLIVRKGMDPTLVRIVNTTGSKGVFFPCDARAERDRFGLTQDQFVVAIHGTIRPGKGYGQLLEWWKKVTDNHSNWRLLIIGGAGGEAWCQREVFRLGIGARVVMTGWLPTRQDVNRLLNAADCLLVVRRNSDDNQGIIPSALYHSLATGKPTVATGLAGMAEIVRHGVDGFLFEPDNYDSFLACLEYVANHPTKMIQIGKAGIQREKECFDPDTSADKLIEAIESVLKKTQSNNICNYSGALPRREST